MASIDFPEDLLALERSAWEAIQAGTLTPEQAHAVHQRVAEFAEEAELPRLEVEMGLKQAVRHAEAAD